MGIGNRRLRLSGASTATPLRPPARTPRHPQPCPVKGIWGGPRAIVERIRGRVADRPVYVSVDIDVLDPAYAPGTGTPESGGLASWQLLLMLRELAGLNLVGGDIVEVAPPYDHAEITGIAATHIGYELLSAWAPPLDDSALKTR